ncbi:MAG: PAS domain S-box protein [Jatrophihabitantaceae bacterium]
MVDDRPSSARPAAVGPVAVIGTTFAGIVTLWSPGAQSMFGWTASEAVGRPVGELADWGLTQNDLAEFIFVGSSGAWIREHEVITRTGVRLMLKTTASLVVGADGNDEVIASLTPMQAGADGSAAVVRDRPFRAIVERGSDLVMICDRNKIISYVGPSLVQMLGHQPREVVGQSVAALLHPDEVADFDRDWQLALSAPGEHRNTELRVRHASGHWRWIELRISNMVADLALTAMVLNLRDVTEYRALADRLAASERLLASITSTAQEGIWQIDTEGRTVLANARMAELLAVDEARLAGGSILEFFDPVAAELLKQRIEHRAAGVREQYEFSFIRLDGQRRWLQVSAVPLYDSSGRYVGSLGMCIDLTVRKLLEHELERRGGSGTPIGRSARGQDGEPDSQVEAMVAEYLRGNRLESPDAARQLDDSVPGLARLSRREFEVVRMLLLGDRVPVIARQLFVSQSTVRNHLSSVFRKLRVRSQQELIVLLRERNLDT